MADDLSDLDELSPAGTDLQHFGDDKIRDTRRQVKNWAGIEHYLTGEHKFKYGAPAARPAAGKAGRTFIDTTNKRVERDDGSMWRMMNAVTAGSYYASGTVLLTTNFQTIATLDVDVAQGGRIFAISQFNLQSTYSGTFDVTYQMLVDGVLVHAWRGIDVVGLSVYDPVIMALTGEQNVDTYTVSVQAKRETGLGDINAWNRLLIVAVL